MPSKIFMHIFHLKGADDDDDDDAAVGNSTFIRRYARFSSICIN